MTEYVILERQDEQRNDWAVVDVGEARSAQSAISGFLGSSPRDVGGSFVAIPKRSWKPVTVKVETKTALKFS